MFPFLNLYRDYQSFKKEVWIPKDYPLENDDVKDYGEELIPLIINRTGILVDTPEKSKLCGIMGHRSQRHSQFTLRHEKKVKFSDWKQAPWDKFPLKFNVVCIFSNVRPDLPYSKKLTIPTVKTGHPCNTG